MKRLSLNIQRWDIYKHRQARRLEIVDEEDSKELQFEDELFERFYSPELEALPDEDMDPELGPWAKRIHAMADELPAFRRLSVETQGMVGLSGVAVDCVIVELKPLMEAEKKRQEELRQNGQEDPFAKDPGQMTPEEVEAMKDAMLKARGAISKAVKVAEKQIGDIKETLNGMAGVMAGSEPGEHPKTQIDLARKLAEALKRGSTKLRHIAKIIGKFRRIAINKHRTKVKHGVDEVTDVVTGNDISRLLPTELMALEDEHMEPVFMRKFYERALLQYELQAVDTTGKGPMVVLLDKSGSMNGEPDAWSTAIAIALADIAKREKRMFAGLSFDTRIIHKAIVDSAKGEKLGSDFLDVQANGGTDIHMALQAGLKLILESKNDLQKADIVLISDGLDSTDKAAAFKKAATDAKIHVFGIMIGADVAPMLEWCHDAVGVSDVAALDDGLATKLFG